MRATATFGDAIELPCGTVAASSDLRGASTQLGEMAWALVLFLGWSAHAPPPLRRAKLSRAGAPLCIDYDVDEPLTAPRDELKVRFSRGDESTATKNTFVEPSAAAAQRAAVAQQQGRAGAQTRNAHARQAASRPGGVTRQGVKQTMQPPRRWSRHSC